MNLLHVVHYPVFGGPHNRALHLQRPLAARGWQTVVLLPDEPGTAADRLRSAGVEVVTIPLHRLREKKDPRVHLRFARDLPVEVARIRRLIHERSIDLVLVNGLVNPHAAIAARFEHVPVVWQLLDTRTPAALRQGMMPFVTRLADVVMTTGMEVACVHPGATALGDRLVSFFPPVDTALFRPDAERRALARAELGLQPGDVVIGNVSNVNPQKGHRTFIRAAAALRGERPGVRFVILGATYQNHAVYAEELWREASSLGLRLGHDLIVRDPGPRVAELAPAFDLFWLTSDPRSEGIPTVIEEAMAMAMAPVAVDVGAVREAVEDGVTGFVVPPLDPAAIAAATLRLLDDPALRVRMGKEARRQAVERFDTEVCADTHVRAFEVAIAHAAQRPGAAARSRGPRPDGAGKAAIPPGQAEADANVPVSERPAGRSWMRTPAWKNLRRKADRAIDLSPQLLRHPSHLRAGLAGIHVGILGTLDKPWLRDIRFSTVLDVGANTGQFARAAHYLFPDARIYSFEPLPACFDALTARMKDVASFEAFPTAIGNEDGTVTIHQSTFSPSSSILPMTSEHTAAFPWTAGGEDVEVEIHSLDHFLPRITLAGEVLLKIDVQGYSQHVLLGAPLTLARTNTVLVETSFVNLYEGEATFDQTYRLLLAAGFVFAGFLDQLTHPETDRILQGDAVFQSVR